MKKVGKIFKVFLAITVVLLVAGAAWLVNGSSTSEASNYSGCPKCIKFDNTKLGWSEVYAYCWNSHDKVDVIKFEASDANTFYGTIPGNTYDSILFKNTPGTDNWDKQTIDLDPPSGPCTFIFEPTSTNNNKVEGLFTTDYYSFITVYYKKDSIKTPYMYYKIGDGNWTSEYGYKMKESTEKAGYYEATVLVYKADSITCCFNNGDNQVAWDNNNSSDYKLNVKKLYNTKYIIDNGTVKAAN